MKGDNVSAKRQLVALAATLAVLVAAPAAAQTWQLTVASGGQSVSSNDLKRTPPNAITGSTATVQVTCQAAADCAKVGLQLEKSGAVVQTLGRSPAGSNDFPVPAGAVNGSVMDLAVTFQGQKIDSFPVTAQAAGGTSSGGGAPPPDGTPPPLADLLTTACPSATVNVGYDAGENLGEILVTPTGSVLARGVNTFDENDKLKVIVYGDARLLPLLKVARTSAFGVPTVRIVGAGTTLPSQLIARQGAGVCTTAEYLLSDFAPGQATVQISALQGTDFVPLGSFDFNVNPLYTGMLSLGAAWTHLVDPDYKIASTGSGSVVALGDDGTRDLLYTLFYTPYVWGKRDLQKKLPFGQWYKRINPTVGIVPQDIENNALIGVTIDLPAGFLVTFGRHFRQITVLPASTGLTVGSPFAGTALPTAESWQDDNFFAVTVDLRAIVQLFNVAVGGSSGGGS
jgi:hypothetical protein